MRQVFERQVLTHPDFMWRKIIHWQQPILLTFCAQSFYLAQRGVAHVLMDGILMSPYDKPEQVKLTAVEAKTFR